MINKIILLISLLFLTQVSRGQTDSLYFDPDIFQAEDISEIEAEYLNDISDYYTGAPLDLNKVTTGQLCGMPLMDYQTAKAIIDYRNQHGRFFSVNELRTLDINPVLLKALFNWLTVYDYENRKLLRNNFSAEVRTRYTDNFENIYSEKVYSRYKIKYRDKLSLAIVTEKDPGENNLADFYSFTAASENLYPGFGFVIGNYIVEFGQGLAVWSPYRFFKNSYDMTQVSGSASGIRPYASTEENRMFRGAAVSYRNQDFLMNLFWSSNKIDAKKDSAGNIISLTETGYHRTSGEIAGRKTAGRNNLGVSLTYSLTNKIYIGALYLNTFLRDKLLEYNSINLGADSFEHFSFSGEYLSENVDFKGEFAVLNRRFAFIASGLLKSGRNIKLSVSYRNYSPDYVSFFSGGFSERGKINNEEGFYLGLRIKSKLGLFNAGIDHFRFPEPYYNVLFPSSGYEVMFSFWRSITEQCALFFRYGYQNKEASAKTEDLRYILVPEKRNRIRSDLVFEVSKNIRLKTRGEYSIYTNSINGSKGFLLFEDIKVAFNFPLTFYARFTVFSTDDFNSTIYQFENNAEGMFYSLPLFNDGSRWYLLALYRLRYFTISARYAETNSLGRNHIYLKTKPDRQVTLQLELNI